MKFSKFYKIDQLFKILNIKVASIKLILIYELNKKYQPLIQFPRTKVHNDISFFLFRRGRVNLIGAGKCKYGKLEFNRFNSFEYKYLWLNPPGELFNIMQ